MLFELCDKTSQLPNPQVMPCLVTMPSAPFDKRSLVQTCLVGTPSWMYNFHHPCLLASHALWCPICLMVPHLPFWRPSAFLTPTSAFRHPICLLQAPSAFWLPILKRPLTKGLGYAPFFSQEAAKKDLVDSADAQPSRQIPPGEIVMQLALIDPAASKHVPVSLGLSSIFVWAHKKNCLASSNVFLDLPCESRPDRGSQPAIL
jgi:hypothetical protein